MDTREAEQQKTATTHQNGRGHDAVAETERKGPPRRVIFGTIGAIVGILILIWGVKWFAYARVHEGTDDARVDADAVAVTSKINEKIDRLLVDTNDPVKRGQLLIVLDNKDELAKVRQAQAQL